MLTRTKQEELQQVEYCERAFSVVYVVGSVGPYPRIVDLVAGMEGRRDAAESSLRRQYHDAGLVDGSSRIAVNLAAEDANRVYGRSLRVNLYPPEESTSDVLQSIDLLEKLENESHSNYDFDDLHDEYTKNLVSLRRIEDALSSFPTSQSQLLPGFLRGSLSLVSVPGSVLPRVSALRIAAGGEISKQELRKLISISGERSTASKLRSSGVIDAAKTLMERESTDAELKGLAGSLVTLLTDLPITSNVAEVYSGTNGQVDADSLADMRYISALLVSWFDRAVGSGRVSDALRHMSLHFDEEALAK
ncbi:hypothetical protein FOL47_002233, partial [Perkinsus chesapeaki]